MSNLLILSVIFKFVLYSLSLLLLSKKFSHNPRSNAFLLNFLLEALKLFLFHLGLWSVLACFAWMRWDKVKVYIFTYGYPRSLVTREINIECKLKPQVDNGTHPLEWRNSQYLHYRVFASMWNNWDSHAFLMWMQNTATLGKKMTASYIS